MRSNSRNDAVTFGQRWRGFFAFVIAAYLWVISSGSLSAVVNRDEIVLEKGEVTISVGDLAEYVSDRVRPEAYKSAVSKKGAVAQSVGNLYIIRRAASLSEAAGLIDPYRLAYVARDAADREAVERFVEAQTSERLQLVDWEALAMEQFITDAELYASEKRVRVSHILVSREGRSFNELVARVAEVEARLKAGEPFDVVAAQMSDDPSAERNRGSLGLVKRGQTVAPFEEVVFAMSEEGSISDPFLTVYGVHLVRFEGMETDVPTSFSDVREAIIQQLKKKRSKLTRDLILEPLRGEVQDQLYLLDEPMLAEGVLDLIDGRTH